jgi:hypothetical protein
LVANRCTRWRTYTLFRVIDREREGRRREEKRREERERVEDEPSFASTVMISLRMILDRIR